jgi:hypothetical protein
VGGACGTHGRGEKVCKVVVGKNGGKRSLGKARRGWKVGIRMDLREANWGDVKWINLAQDRDRWRDMVNAVMNLRVLEPRN